MKNIASILAFILAFAFTANAQLTVPNSYKDTVTVGDSAKMIWQIGPPWVPAKLRSQKMANMRMEIFSDTIDTVRADLVEADSGAFRSLSCINCYFNDSTINVTDSVVRIAKSGAIDSMLVTGVMRTDSGSYINGIYFGHGRDKYAGSYEDSATNIIIVNGCDSLPKGVHLNLSGHAVACNADSLDDVSAHGYFALANARIVKDLATNGNSSFRMLRYGEALSGNGWRACEQLDSSFYVSCYGSRTLEEFLGDTTGGFGEHAFRWLRGGVLNLAVGPFAGKSIFDGTELIYAVGSMYVGPDSRASKDSTRNEQVVGVRAIGFGDSTFTIGNQNIKSIVPGGTLNADLGALTRKFKTAFVRKVYADSFISAGTNTTGLPIYNVSASNRSYSEIETEDANGIGWGLISHGNSTNNLTYGIVTGGSKSSPSATPDGRLMYAIDAFGYTSSYTTSSSSSARIAILSDGAWSAGANQGTYIGISGTSNGSTSRAEWARFYRSNMLIGTTTNVTSARLNVAGGMVLTAASTTSYPSIRLPAGTAPTSCTNGDMWFDGSDYYGCIASTPVQLNN